MRKGSINWRDMRVKSSGERSWRRTHRWRKCGDSSGPGRLAVGRWVGCTRSTRRALLVEVGRCRCRTSFGWTSRVGRWNRRRSHACCCPAGRRLAHRAAPKDPAPWPCTEHRLGLVSERPGIFLVPYLFFVFFWKPGLTFGKVVQK